MGRRAADLTTPVPVLGVPALVGVRGWKTAGEDKSGGVLLQAWGIQCSVGVQTSPGISRPPTQLPDTLSDNVIQTSNSDISKETEEILLLTRSDNEKRAILKQKTGESKIKKEVTFKALGGDASQDVACHQKNSSGTYCYARAIKTNQLSAGTVTSGRPKLKSAARYTNGSVVDSEAIGGISVVNDESEAVKRVTSHGRGLHDHYADQSGKMLPQKICSHCGGRQPMTAKADIRGESSPTPDTYFREKHSKPALTSHSSTIHFQATCIDNDIKTNQLSQSISDTEKRSQITVNPQLLYLNEEPRHRKKPHPACPVHSRGSLATLSQTRFSSDATSIQPATILQAKTITITKATIENRQDDSSVNCFARPPEDNKILLHTGPTLTPQMTTVAKPNKPDSHTNPEEYVPQNICVSVHATSGSTPSPPPYLYSVAMDLGKTSSANISKTVTVFTSGVNSTDSKVIHVESLHSLNKAQTSKVTTTSSQAATKDHLLSPSINVSEAIHKSELQANPLKKEGTPTCSVPTSPGKMSLVDAVVSSPTCPAFSNPKTTTTYSLLSTAVPQRTLNHEINARQIMHTRIHSSNSETLVNVSTSSLCAVSPSTSPDSRNEYPASAALSSTVNGTQHKNSSCGNIAFDLKTFVSTTCSQSPRLREMKNHACASSSLPSTETTNMFSCNESLDRSKAHHTQAADIRSQDANEPGVLGVIPNQESYSRKPQNMSEDQSIGNDASSHNSKTTPDPNEELESDKNKFNGNLIIELDVHESKRCGISNLSQVTSPQNYISLIESSSSCLQGCLNTEQQRLGNHQGYRDTNHEGRCATSPPVKAAQCTESNSQLFAFGAAARHTHLLPNSNTDRKAHPNYSSPSVTTKANLEPIVSHTSRQVKAITTSSACQKAQSDKTSPTQSHKSPAHSVTARAPKYEGDLCEHTGPDHTPILASPTTHPASSSHLQASAISRPNSKSSLHKSFSEDTSLAHSHPADADLLLPPSPQCSKSAALQERLETVEASLAANKDRITTLLNIIRDLETCRTPISR